MKRQKTGYTPFLLILMSILSISARGGESAPEPDDLGDLSIEQLMNIEITSASKHKEKLSCVPSAAYVITAEDIRRSSANSIVDLLRTVPGVQVAQSTSGSWAITARGFNGTYAQKLLVLIDGRTVYSPTFSGVFWEALDTVLTDVERIEVIRGPGATVWGANAVNGVINIITKNSSQTQGGLLQTTAGTGNEENGSTTIRYGGKIGESTHYRAFMKGLKYDGLTDANRHDTHDDWSSIRGGFRFDTKLSKKDELSVQGDIYRNNIKSGKSEYYIAPAPYVINTNGKNSEYYGGHIQAKWERTIREDSEISLQTYFSRNNQNTPSRQFDEMSDDTFDMEFQHSFRATNRHLITWGLGYRHIETTIQGPIDLTAIPTKRCDNLYSGFIQDEITLIEKKLNLTVGSKYEHNDYSGSEYQPSARLSWTPNLKTTVWASASRAVRTPSRMEYDGIIVRSKIDPNGLYAGSPVAFVALTGTNNMEPELLTAYETGLRLQPRHDLSLDVAFFFNDYNNLRTFEQSTPQLSDDNGIFFLYVPVMTNNKLHGKSYGAELSAMWQPIKKWKIKANYSYIEMRLTQENNSNDDESWRDEKNIPQNQFSLTSMLDLPKDLEFDTTLRYVDDLEGLEVASYVGLDFRLGWSPRENFDISLVGRNVCDPIHQEYKESAIFDSAAREVERTFYARVTWTF